MKMPEPNLPPSQPRCTDDPEYIDVWTCAEWAVERDCTAVGLLALGTGWLV